ncbi:hypothetical protein AFLA_008848 [Aspergillus flavus NRRL3357]|nr:hypothetical protein AFLA_008848 [Aspergillus flavus NRRL3357]
MHMEGGPDHARGKTNGAVRCYHMCCPFPTGFSIYPATVTTLAVNQLNVHDLQVPAPRYRTRNFQTIFVRVDMAHMALALVEPKERGHNELFYKSSQVVIAYRHTSWLMIIRSPLPKARHWGRDK